MPQPSLSDQPKLSNTSQEVFDFIKTKTMNEPEILQRLREETLKMGPRSIMQISPDQGQFFKTLIHLTKARKIVEVGVFTGYSSLSMALALPRDEGKVRIVVYSVLFWALY